MRAFYGSVECKCWQADEDAGGDGGLVHGRDVGGGGGGAWPRPSHSDETRREDEPDMLEELDRRLVVLLSLAAEPSDEI